MDNRRDESIRNTYVRTGEGAIALERRDEMGVKMLTDKLNRNEAVVCVVGLGYVGLPLAIEFSKSLRVIGYEIDEDKYMFNIVWDFQKRFYKIAIVSQCHKPKSVDLPQLIEHVRR